MTEKNLIDQSGVFAYRRHGKNLQVMLVCSLDRKRWVLPKGHIEKGLTMRESAIVEAYEEAGVEGDTAKKSIGYFDYFKSEQKGGGEYRVHVYPMKVNRVLDDWPEADKRKRKWMSVEIAIELVKEKKLQKLLDQFDKKMADE